MYVNMCKTGGVVKILFMRYENIQIKMVKNKMSRSSQNRINNDSTRKQKRNNVYQMNE